MDGSAITALPVREVIGKTGDDIGVNLDLSRVDRLTEND